MEVYIWVMESQRVPFFSIITPVYNGKNYPAQTIESVLSQTFEGWELILIDDNRPEFLEKLAAYLVSKPAEIDFFISSWVAIIGNQGEKILDFKLPKSKIFSFTVPPLIPALSGKKWEVIQTYRWVSTQRRVDGQGGTLQLRMADIAFMKQGKLKEARKDLSVLLRQKNANLKNCFYYALCFLPAPAVQFILREIRSRIRPPKKIPKPAGGKFLSRARAKRGQIARWAVPATNASAAPRDD